MMMYDTFYKVYTLGVLWRMLYLCTASYETWKYDSFGKT